MDTQVFQALKCSHCHGSGLLTSNPNPAALGYGYACIYCLGTGYPPLSFDKELLFTSEGVYLSLDLRHNLPILLG